MRIDAHQHFWRYDPAEYGWLSDSMSALRRDFLSRDLEPELAAADLDGSVCVQARHCLAESRFLLEQARSGDAVSAVVGWLPLAGPGLGQALDEFAADPKFCGCRHALQDEPDDDYMLRAEFGEGLRAVTAAGLTYDILIYERHLPQTLRLVDRHPRQVFVLDHIGKPRIRDGSFGAWSRHLRDLARRQNVYCKVSGMVTEAEWGSWTYGRLVPYLETVLEAFGVRRLMYGSDWPMCLLAASYGRWFDAFSRFASGLSCAERDRILGGTAAEVYGIPPAGTMAIPAGSPCHSSFSTA